MRRVLVALLCLPWLGCSRSTSTISLPVPCSQVVDTIDRPVDPGGVEHLPMRVRIPLALTTTGDCPRVQLDLATVTVTDATNQPVANTWALNTEPDGPAAYVLFTPPRYGWYHLSVVFAPQLPSRQFDVLVAAERSDAGFHTIAAPGCIGFDVAAGIPLCHDGNGVLTAYWPDGGEATVDVTRFSADEAGRVWTVKGLTELHVYALDGGAFVELAASPLVLGAPVATLARGGRAAVVETSEIDFWELSDGGLSVVEQVPLRADAGADVWCLHFSPPDLTESFDLAAFNSATLSVGQDVFAAGPATGLSLLAGADDDGIWWTNGSVLSVQPPRLVQDAGVVLTTPYTGGAAFTALCPESEQTPILGLNQLVPRLHGDEILVEKYPVYRPLSGANSRIVWGIDGGTLYWFDRPALP